MTIKSKKEDLARRRAVITQGPLHAEKREGFKRRWVNLNPHSVQKAIELGYEKVKNTTLRGDSVQVENSDDLSNYCVNTDKNGKKQILMECPEEIYYENQSIKQEIVNDNEASIKPVNDKDRYGYLEIKRNR